MKWWQVIELMEEENGGEGNGGGAKTQEQKDIDALKGSIAALEKKNKELLDENKAAKDGLKNWDGLDAEKVRAMLKQFDNDEEMKLISEGKHDEVIKKRTEKVAVEFQSKIDAVTTERDDIRKQLDAANSQVQKLLIDNNAVASFIQAGGRETAIDDVVARALAVFKIENGEPIPRDKSGQIMAGKDGVMTMKEWAEGLRETAPHLFPESSGAGTNGSRSNSKPTGIDAQIIAARKSGDVKKLRELTDKKRAQDKK